jgi:uncharacterized protein (TIGR03083 family)
LAACRRFSEAVAAADGKWDRRSPCEGWDARDVVEHVIGFHDVLLLRPLGRKPERPRDNPRRRWEITFDRLVETFDEATLFERTIDIPSIGRNQPTTLNARALVPRLTRDVLVHTWDLARAVGADDRLDPQWCERFVEELSADPSALSATGMFAPPVVTGARSDPQSTLLYRLGRDPEWDASTA